MNVDFFQSIYNHPLIRKIDLKDIISEHQKIRFSKGTVFLENGKMANEYYLIESGLLRAFVHDLNGNEITTDFHGENEISIEVSSLFQRIPTNENIVALTNGVAWKIEFQSFQELFHKIEGLREWGRAWMSKQLFSSKQRSIDIHTKSATERYLNLIKDKPKIIQQSPIKHVASYLGITDTSLSRIRKEIRSD
ncbi:Crp/Fnr family transcriptional regulator [Zhouia amylolytica]|uniref:Crp/Fnr family transcriptional regulator n=1 Tax=Zhouia amylolytica TaxID=376730 RepID=UPI0020CC8EC3|nr:Crp/Fnr family transcriptional regulator [Zhouia amylolytica]MCQ0110201.1 Crp/Fnr family transcriptional regulator [Zhouia amylolytica]